MPFRQSTVWESYTSPIKTWNYTRDENLNSDINARRDSPSSDFTTSSLSCTSLVTRVSVSFDILESLLPAGQEQWQGKEVDFWAFCLR